jgi:DNA-binding CsgD family transcriptional regulator
MGNITKSWGGPPARARRVLGPAPPQADEVAVIEAAYRVDGAEARWLTGLAEATLPMLDRGLGISAFTARFTGATLKVTDIVTIGGPRGLADATVDFTEGADPAMMARAFSASPCVTMSAAAGGRDRLRADPASEALFQIGVNDAIGILGTDGTPFVTGLSVFLAGEAPLSRAFTSRWSRVASHLSAGSRIRRALAAVDRPARGTDLLSGAEAILTSSGSLAHAEGPAQKARAQLARAVVAIDRARSRLRRDDPDEAVEAWRCLVSGRWSLLEHFDSDGRRFLVARKNDPETPGPSAISLRERQILLGRARGLPLKLISYDLGLSIGAVSKTLRSGMKKLGLTHEAELIAALSLSAPRSPE